MGGMGGMGDLGSSPYGSPQWRGGGGGLGEGGEAARLRSLHRTEILPADGRKGEGGAGILGGRAKGKTEERRGRTGASGAGEQERAAGEKGGGGGEKGGGAPLIN